MSQTNGRKHFTINDISLNTLLFADDQVILAETEDDLQYAVYKQHLIANQYDLKISIPKTKVLAFRGEDHLRAKIIIENKIIEQVDCFTYLGYNVSYTDKKDLQAKLNKFRYTCGTIMRCLRDTSKETKLKFYKVMAVPILMYGSENWTLTQKERKLIESVEMKFLRHVAGYKLIDRKRSEEIRQELNIFKILEKIDEFRNNWTHHLMRMDDSRIPKALLRYRPRGKRRLGRPKKRWSDQ